MKNKITSAALKTQRTSERLDAKETLTDERLKTNQSILNAQEKTEKKTDNEFLQRRNEADHAMSSSRLNSNDNEEKNATKLEEERRRADTATDYERSQVDIAIAHERTQMKSDMAFLLDQERQTADSKMTAQQSQMDSDTHNASELLSSEIDEHQKTKFSLTTRDEFLAIVSHDLRNPIGAAFTCAEILLTDSAYKDMDKEVRYWIELMKRNIDTSLHLIRDLLDMERIAEGKMQVELAPQNINKMIRESIESFVHVASGKNILLRSISISKMDEVVCDKDRIMQVLSNLIGNALKFTPSGGSIVLDTKINKTTVEFSVLDTGSGIAKEKKNSVFERFAQLQSKDRTGLGLGLHISKMIVELHKGHIWLDSELGKGSVFSFSLPRS